MSNLGRTDVERIVEGVLRNLKVEVTPSLNSNRLKIELKLNNDVLSTSYFSINEEDYGG
jgi:hypothetical protein